MKHLFVVVLIALSALACQKNETTTARSEAPTGTAAAATTGGGSEGTAEKTHTMTGTLVSRNAATNEVTIDNDEVPGGVMAKMEMAYELRGGNVNELPADGTKITSTLHEQNGKYWVSDVKAAQ